jgi:hypothetical protein
MALIGTLVDDFNDNTVNAAIWVNNFGTVSETGGRARVTCDTGFNAYSSGLAYTLQGSQVLLRVYPNAAGGASTDAWTQVLVKSSTAGTDLAMERDAITDTLKMGARVAFAYSAVTSIAYSAVSHLWWRIRESGGQTFYETAPDGLTWTTRKTETSVALVDDVDLEFQLIAHRNSGTNDFAEFDNVNVLPPMLPKKTSVSTAVRRASTW